MFTHWNAKTEYFSLQICMFLSAQKCHNRKQLRLLLFSWIHLLACRNYHYNATLVVYVYTCDACMNHSIGEYLNYSRISSCGAHQTSCGGLGQKTVTFCRDLSKLKYYKNSTLNSMINVYTIIIVSVYTLLQRNYSGWGCTYTDWWL